MKVDANMYWIPEKLFTDEDLREEFLRCIPVEHGVIARCEQIAGTDKKQIVIEEPAGCQNLNYVQGGIPGGASACGYGCGGSG